MTLGFDHWPTIPFLPVTQEAISHIHCKHIKPLQMGLGFDWSTVKSQVVHIKLEYPKWMGQDDINGFMQERHNSSVI